MSKRVLYLTYDGLTDPLGQSQVLPYMAALAKAGFSITIISFEKPEAFRKFGNQIQQRINEQNIQWHALNYTKHPPVISTLWDIYQLKKLTFMLHSVQNFDVVHCRSYITSMVGLSLKLKRGVKFLFDMRGFWADERIEGGIWNKRNPIFHGAYRYFKKKEVLFLNNADHVITLTHKSKTIIDSWKLKNQPIPISVIPTCVDTHLFDKRKVVVEKVNEIRNKLKLTGGTFVLTYIGSLGTWYMLREMIFFFSLLLKREADSVFVIVTRDSHEQVYEFCKEYNVSTEKIRIVSSSHQEIPHWISISNWSLFFIKSLFSKSASTPTKLAEILSMGKPVICNGGVGDLDLLFQQYKLGLCVGSITAVELEGAIDYILKNRTLEPDYSPVATQFSLSTGVEKLTSIYNG